MSKPEFQFTGRVVAIGAIRRVGKQNKPTCDLVVDWGDKYPSPVPCECFGEEMQTQIAGVAVGDVVTVDGYLTGREWNGKYYASAKATSIAVEGGGRTARTEPAPHAPVEAAANAVPSSEEMPF